MEEAHRDVEGGAAPHLHGEAALEDVVGRLGGVHELLRAHARGEQRLVRVTVGRVGEQDALVLADGLGEALGAALQQHLAPALAVPVLARGRGVGQGRLDGGDGPDAVELGRVRAELGGVAVDGDVGEVAHEALDLEDVLLVGLLATLEVPRGAGDLEQLGVLVDEGSGHDARLEDGVREHVEEEGDVRLDAADAGLLQRALHAADDLLPVAARGGVLDEERVVVGLDHHAGVADAVHAHAEAGRVAVDGERAGVGREVALGVLGGDAALHGDARGVDVLLHQTDLLEGRAARDAHLRLDEVDAGDLLGDGVLHLDAGVDLDEVVLAVGLDEELDGAGVQVVGALDQPERVVLHLLAQLGREVPRGRDLDDLLVAALDGAVTLPQVDRAALAVAEDLDLDVTGAVDEALDENGAVAEGGLRLGGGRLEEGHEVLNLTHDAHALAAATHGRLHDDGQAELLDEVRQLLHVGDRAVRAGHDRHAGLDGLGAGGRLVGELVHVLDGRANEGDARVVARLDHLRRLGEEAVARVDRVDALLLRQLDDLLRRQVCSDRALAGANLERLVGLVAVQAAQVFLGIDGDGLDVHLRRGAADTDRDLATVCRENLPDRPPAGADRWRRLKDECRHSPG
mmetsp:Transcript_15979/g.37862  ORF Transcript_15979/g.37862 Transcript_15979/m.37862 type:complete len:629 (-) Transcript_15979:82-1968(-)